MKYCIFLWAALFLSCSNESSVQLPQIVHSGNSIEKNDSKAFMKYDKNASEPLHFRGSDLPSVFYIDSRISLKLLLPETIKLMDKKRSTTDGKNSEKSYFAFKTNKNDDVRLWDSSEIEYHQVANESAAEIALLQALVKTERIGIARASVNDALTRFEPLIPFINRFFDEVLVMADDLAVRSSRLGLLQRIAALMNGTAALSLLE
ncbi:MAG TPA: hypothetical protein PKI08_02105, partial [Aquaticitalea sp.]|nr:hypothetical protein [Aquaticitalea sp.]